MSDQETHNVPVVSYISRELLTRVQLAARQSNRSLAGEVRNVLEQTYKPRETKTR